MFKSIATATVSLALLMGTTSLGAAPTAAAASEPAAERVDGQALYGWNPLGYLLLAELLAAFLLLGAEWADDDDDGPVATSP